MKAIIDLVEKKIVLERNQYLKVKGSIDNNVYYIESGSFRIFVLDDLEEQIIRFGYQNDLIASLDSYLTGKASDFYIQAIKKSVVGVIPKYKMDAFFAEDNNHLLWRNMLESLVLQQMEREVDILTASPKQRYLRVLERSPRLFQEIPHRYIANYLRMSAETLSRLKNS